ncbi:upstream stimulatory factor 1-like [Rhodnius prolixus]|uniref:Putative helix loop helix transcription factor eb rhodnius neglectus n=2 Tax=Rhodnius TaxID=13248 RepID=A0A4P6D9A6_RHOPR
MDIIENSLDGSEDKVLKGEVSEELLTPGLSIVEEDGSVGSPEEHQITTASALIDTSIDTTDNDDVHYEFREDGVTYRVVQLGESVEELQTTTIAHNHSGGVQSPPQPVQTIYTNPINGGIYVIGTPHEVFPLGNTAQKTFVPKLDDNARPTITRDDKRRATHNEVERRRRDKINSWIVKLGKIIPECKQESVKGSFESQSKGGILAKACDYITELRESNQRLMAYAKENEQLLVEVDTLVQKCDLLKSENDKLRALLRQNGVTIV